MEHRSVQRYRISIPTTFCFGVGSSRFEGNGVSRDVSTHGAFILTTETVPVGSDISLKLVVPGMREGLKGSEMKGNGRVVRAENEGFAVAAAIGFSTKKETWQKSGSRGKSCCVEDSLTV